MGNLADMQGALVDYIDMVGMSGYASKEAADTISGSIASAKAAWVDLLSALGKDTGELKKAIQNFVKTIVGENGEGGVLGNILPKVDAILDGIMVLVEEFVPQVIEKIPGLVQKYVPMLAESAMGLIEKIISSIDENKNSLAKSLATVVANIISHAAQHTPEVIGSVLDFILTLIEELGNNLDKIIPEFIASIINVFSEIARRAPALTNAVFAIIRGIVNILTSPKSSAEMIAVGIELMISIITGLLLSIPELLTNLDEIIRSILGIFKGENWEGVGGDLISRIGDGVGESWGEIKKSFSELWEKLQKWFSTISKSVKNVGKKIIKWLKDGITEAWESVKSWFEQAWDSLFNNRTIDVSFFGSGGVDGSHAGGLDYVPFDGYIAELHKGEQVLTAEEARDYKKGGKVVNVVQNIYSQAKSAADLMQEAQYQQEMAVLFGV